MNSANEIWLSILPTLQESFTDIAFKTWFDGLEPLDFQMDKLYLSCPTDFKAKMVNERFRPNIMTVLKDLFNAEIEVQVLGPAEAEAYGAQPEEGEPNQNVLMGSEEYTFDRFVVGASNRLAFNASMAVAEKPGKSYNPLFLYGESGLGKTHLLYSIYHTIHREHPDYQIIYIKGDEFTNELSEAIRTRTTDLFRQKYRDKDLLLVDDIHFIAGKEQTQEEFFNTFNNLHEAGRQIVLTSDRPPSDMLRLEDRLRTRFEMGLMADIQPPDYETRCAIIKNKSLLLGLNLPPDIIEYIAQNITANVRQLEGTINRLLAYRELMGKDINDENVSRAIRELIRQRDEFTPSPEVILEETAKFYDLDPATITGSSRKSDIVLARQVSMYIIRNLTTLSLPEVGKIYGQHHTTVMHSVDKIEKSIHSNTELKEVIRDIKANINDRF
jgi:chromosomal replication initiator protein